MSSLAPFSTRKFCSFFKANFQLNITPKEQKLWTNTKFSQDLQMFRVNSYRVRRFLREKSYMLLCKNA